jgi:hypothetical protein
MEWSAPLPSAFSTVVARPPPDLRRLYFSTISLEEIEAIELRGPRGFRQRIDREFQGKGPYAWISMPGLQCNDTISYTYEGRYEHLEKEQTLDGHPVLRLAPPDQTWRYALSAHVGGGTVVSELGEDEPFISVGVRVGAPFRKSQSEEFNVLHWRSSGGVRLVWQLEGELQLTHHPYKALIDSTPSARGRRAVDYQREIVWLGLGYGGFRVSPGFWRTLAPTSAWLRVGVGRGAPLSSNDASLVGANDPLFGLQIVLQRRLYPKVAIEAVFGLLLDEDIREYEGDLRGQPMTVFDNGWHGIRPSYGFQLTVTP